MSARRRRLDVAPRAQRDIRSIRHYSLEHWGERQANAYHATLRRAIESLRDNPQLGVARDDLASGLRSHPVERHTIYYRIKGDIVQIVRILHARQDAAAALQDEALP